MDITIKFCAAFCVGLFGGIAVDHWLHTSPWGVLTGIVAGLGLSAGVIVQCIIQENKRLANADPIVIKPRPARQKAPNASTSTDGGTLLTIDDLHHAEAHPAESDPELKDDFFDDDD